MSSEKSVDENDEDEQCKIIKVKKLAWRSAYLNKWFKALDSHMEKKNRSSGSARSYTRSVGSPSSRSIPQEPLRFAVRSDEEI